MKNLIFEFEYSEDRDDFIEWIKLHTKNYNVENDMLDVNSLEFKFPKYSDENYLGDEINIIVKNTNILKYE